MTRYRTAYYTGHKTEFFTPYSSHSVEITTRLGKVYVTRVHGYENATYSESQLRYANMFEFLDEWTDIHEEE